MSFVLAVPFGVASAVVYGTSIVVQHRTAQEHAGDGGDASASGLLRLRAQPAWLLAIGGDFVGFVLQIVALSTGPVVIIQPLVVLMLPVSLGVSFLLGRPRGRSSATTSACSGVLGGLAVFLALVGKPGQRARSPLALHRHGDPASCSPSGSSWRWPSPAHRSSAGRCTARWPAPSSARSR